jgi:hypothetical protein
MEAEFQTWDESAMADVSCSIDPPEQRSPAKLSYNLMNKSLESHILEMYDDKPWSPLPRGMLCPISSIRPYRKKQYFSVGSC